MHDYDDVRISGILLPTSAKPRANIRSKNVVDIDLRLGIVRGYSNQVTFVLSPSLANVTATRRAPPAVTSSSSVTSFDECSARSVVRIDFSGRHKVAHLRLTYSRPRLWTFDASTSSTGDGYGDGGNGDRGGDGYGGGGGSAEAHIVNRQLRLYANRLTGYGGEVVDGGLLLRVQDDILRDGETLQLDIADGYMSWTSATTTDSLESRFLFALGGRNASHERPGRHVYIGFNRVVGGEYRTGSGLCRATITMQTLKGKQSKC